VKRLLIIGGGSLLLLLGILVGAVYGSARTANANATSTTASTSLTTANTSSATNNYCAQFQQDLAKRLGVSADKLQSAESGAAKDMIDQMVKDGKLTQAQATQIESHLGDATNCNFQGLGKGNKTGFANMQKLQQYLTAAEAQVAKGLGISSADLTSQLQSGKSLHDIATAHKVSDTQLKTLLTNAIQSELKQAVSAGDITQSQSDMVTKMLTSNPNLLNRLINGHKGQQEQGMPSGGFGF
jgi:polyhydroxyalkanoate synthesis regulator phasin